MTELVSHAYRFVAYLLEQPFWKKSRLSKIILYGSVARGDYTASSDIDLFFDVKGNAGLLTEHILRAERAFRREMPSPPNEFSIIVDDLSKEKWSDMRRAMSLHAIALWERYSSEPASGLKQFALVRWSVGAKDIKTRVKLARAMYGYSRDGKKYPGLLAQIGAQQVSRSVVLVAGKHADKIRRALDDLRVKYTLRDVYSYE